MATTDTCCTIVPYFKVKEGELDAFKSLCEDMVASTSKEEKALFYGFSFDGHEAHCREGYADAQGVLTHIDTVMPLLQKALAIAEITRLEVHGPEAELAKLREPLSSLSPRYFVLEYGFRKVA